MMDEIKRIYEATKLDEMIPDQEGPAPITFTHVFHKKYPRLPKIQLTKDHRKSDLENLFEKRESKRNFSGSITLEDISFILNSCRIIEKEREPERRTYPSAGARFPVELYLLSFETEGLDMGAYHYSIIENELELLWEKDLRNNIDHIVSPYISNPSAAVIMTSVLARSEVKYGAKAYPYSLIEAGHMGQNILLACAEADIGACPVGGFINDELTEIIDLTPDEIVLYVIALGQYEK